MERFMEMNLVSTANETKAFEEIDVMFSQPPAAIASVQPYEN